MLETLKADIQRFYTCSSSSALGVGTCAFSNSEVRASRKPKALFHVSCRTDLFEFTITPIRSWCQLPRWSSKMCTQRHPNERATVPREKPRETFPILPAYGTV